MTLLNLSGDDLRKAAGVAHTADFLRRYPGETVTFHTRADIPEPVLKFRLHVTVPQGLEVVDYHLQNHPDLIPIVTWDDDATHLIWDVEREPLGPLCFAFQAGARVLPAAEDRFLESKAVLSAQIQGFEQVCQEETVSVLIDARAHYLKYLPSIYHDDEIMSQLLMLFESFLAPVDGQIKDQASYFDPKLAPAEFLPWLASWSGLELDADLPESRRRKLVGAASSLFEERGTRQGMQEYLELATGGKVKIVEHFSQNFRLDEASKLGLGIALGTDNIPNTFTVNLRLPPLPTGLNKTEKKRLEEVREARIRAMIDKEKPAHAGYVLRLETEPETDTAGAR